MNNTEISYKKMLGIIAVSAIAAFIGMNFLSLLLGLFIYLVGMSSDINFNESSQYIAKWIYNDIVIYTPPLIVFGLALKKHMYNPSESGKTYRSVIIPIFVAMYALVNISMILTYQIAEFSTRFFGTGELKDVFKSVMPENQSQWLTMFFFTGFIAPIAEELIFRHMLLRPLRRFGNKQAVIITALMFGAFHANLTQFFYTAVAGAILAIVAVKTNSVKPAIILHILNNIFNLGSAYLSELSEQGILPINQNELSIFTMLFILTGLISAVILAIKGQFILPYD